MAEKINIMDGMDRIREKRSLWKRKKFWISVVATLFLIVIVIMLLGKNVSTVRTEKDKISISPVSEEIFNDYIRVIGSVEPIRFIYLDAEIGQSIPPGQRMGQVNDLSGFKVTAKIDEHYIDRVK